MGDNFLGVQAIEYTKVEFDQTREGKNEDGEEVGGSGAIYTHVKQCHAPGYLPKEQKKEVARWASENETKRFFDLLFTEYKEHSENKSAKKGGKE